jgi:hypothetical protein
LHIGLVGARILTLALKYPGTFMPYRKKKLSKSRQSHFPEFINQIISAATASPPGRAKPSAIRCFKKPGHHQCPGRAIVHETASGEIEWQCSSCKVAGSIIGWQGCWADLSDLRLEDGEFHFEIVLPELEYDILKKYLVAESEADIVTYSAVYLAGNVILKASDIDLKVLADILASKAKLETKTRMRELLLRVLKAIQAALGESSTG